MVKRWINVGSTLDQCWNDVVTTLDQRCKLRWIDNVWACTSIDAATLTVNIESTLLVPTLGQRWHIIAGRCWTNVGNFVGPTLYRRALLSMQQRRQPTLRQHWEKISQRWSNVVPTLACYLGRYNAVSYTHLTLPTKRIV